MNDTKLRRRLTVAAAMGMALAAASATADPPQPGFAPGHGMGPGMMHGPGPGYGMGPGMMHGYGPGMMHGYGPGFPMAPGMMHGYGPGMMHGYGPGYGFGPGMMEGCGSPSIADATLTDDQRGKIDKILQDAHRERWELMGKMRAQRWQMRELYGAPKRDDAALRDAFSKLSALRQQMFELSLATRPKIDAVLTKEQRESLDRRQPGMWRY
jgi:Spy/CpxP family protein refolding chaperone